MTVRSTVNHCNQDSMMFSPLFSRKRGLKVLSDCESNPEVWRMNQKNKKSESHEWLKHLTALGMHHRV